MQSDLSQSRVVITGGSRGIGLAIAAAFAAEGADVSICARNDDALQAAQVELARHGGTVHADSCDVRSAAAIENYIEQAATALGGIDILINNASGFGGGDTEEGWAASIEVDLLGTVRTTRAALPWLERSSRASVVHIASIAGLGASARIAAYGAIKAALMHYATSQAAALASKGIRVNAVAPGSIEFPGGLWDKRKADNPALYESTVNSVPFRRLGRADEVANAVVFLASPLASWITGQTLAVDGGQILRS